MRGSINLKPQDVLVLLKLYLSQRSERPRLIDLAVELGMSPSEVSQGIKRAGFAGLCDPVTGKPFPAALREFVLHGLKYVFPTRIGQLTRGIPTSHSAPPLNEHIVSGEPYVWPASDGEVRGQAIDPLYPSVPHAIKKDPKLYEMLALIDALRVGQARERKFAFGEIEKRLSV